MRRLPMPAAHRLLLTSSIPRVTVATNQALCIAVVLATAMATGLAPAAQAQAVPAAGDSPPAAKPQMELQLGHSGFVNALAFSPDGATVASAGADGTVKLWDTGGRGLKVTLLAPEAPIVALHFSSDGKTLTGAGMIEFGAVQLVHWDTTTTTNRLVPIAATLETGTDAAFAFSPDGKTLACGCGGGIDGKGQLAVIDTATGKALRSQVLSSFEVMSLAYAPDGQSIAVGGRLKKAGDYGGKGEVRLLNARNGQWLRTLRRAGTVFGKSDPTPVKVAFSPDGKTVAGALVVGEEMVAATEVEMWDTATGRLRHSMQQMGVAGSLSFSPDGRILASTGAMYTVGEVKLWDTATGRAQNTLTGNADYIFPAAFAPDGNTLAIHGLDAIVGRDILAELAEGKEPKDFDFGQPGDEPQPGNLTLWSLPEKKATTMQVAHAQPFAAARTSGGRLITAAKGEDVAVNLWDAATGRLQFATKGNAPVALSPDGSVVAIPGFTEWVVKVGSKTSTKKSAAKGAGKGQPSNRLLTETQLVSVVRLRSAKDGKLLRTIAARSSNRSDTIAFSPNGKLMAVAGFGDHDSSNPDSVPTGVLTLWEVATGKRLRQLRTYGAYSGNPVAFSPDGKSVATGGQVAGTEEMGAVQIWDVGTGKLRRALRAPVIRSGLDSINSLAFSPDGTLLASRDTFGTVLWDVKTGKVRRVLEDTGYIGGDSPDEGGTLPLAFSPDGTLLATETGEFDVLLWRVKDGKLVRALSGHRAGITGLAFTAANTLASTSYDNTLKFWDSRTGRLLATTMVLSTGATRTAGISEWITFTPEGYYDSSPGASKFIRWRVGNELQPADDHESTMHRPELVRQVLEQK